MRKAMILAAILAIALGTARAEDQTGYPYPVKSFEFESQRQHLQMAYMDEFPAMPIRTLFCSCMARTSLTPGTRPSTF